MSDTPKVIIPGNLKGSVPENIVTDALYILDSSRAKNQKVINDEFEQRIDDIQELAEISIEGGTIQIANAADFNNPTQEQRAKVPTVGAVIDGYTANILPNTGNPSTPIYIDNFHRPQVVTSILLPGNISSQNGNIEALNGGVAAFGIGTLSLGGGGGGGDVSSILFNPAVPYVEGEGYIAVEGILSLPAYPGSASVQSWGFAKGIKIGATSTPYFSEAGIITIPAYPNISGKADKVVNATEGNFASLDALGNLQDAGVNALSFATAAQGAKADAAEIALAQIMTPKGNHSLPVYINTSGIPTVIDSLSVTGNIQSTQGGVSAFGIGSLALGGGGGQGTLTEIQIDGTTIPDVEGIVDLPAYPTWATLSGRPTLSAVATSGRFIDLTDTPTTLAGYGILDAKINNGVITLGLDTITPITSHQTIYTLTIQKNGATVDSFNAASANKTINIEDVASLSAFNTLVGHLTSKGSHSRPIYLNGTPEGVEIDSLNVPGNIESTQGGVSANGIATLALNGGGGGGTLTQIQINGIPLSEESGIVNIAADQTYNASTNKIATQATVTNAINALDYTAIGLGTGKTLASLTEVNGVIGATFQDISIAISQVSGLQSALDNKLSTSLKGAANGLAELDANGLVPSSQLPSYVDDVLEYASKSAFPSTGETGKIYVALDTNLTYRWSGTAYVEISPSLALGETSSTAYRGDRGAIAYSHATDVSRLTTAQSTGFYKFSTTSEGHVAGVSSVGWSDITSLDNGTTYAPYNSAGYLPLSGGTMANTNLVTNLNADLLDGVHLSGLFTLLENNNNQISITIGGENKKLTVDYANVAGRVGTTTVGSTSLPVYINSGTPTIIDSLTVPGNIQSTSGGVSAFGIASLNALAGGGQGTLTEIQINGTRVPDSSGIVNITALSDTNGQIKIADQAITINGWQTVSDYSFEGHTAYGWGNHANAGYLLASTAASTYLPLSGGTLSNNTYEAQLSIKRTTANDAVIKYENSDGYLGAMGIGANHGPYVTFDHGASANTLWHAGNDGSDSGLDADLLDGQHGSYYAAASSLSNYLPLSGGTLTGSTNFNNYCWVLNGNEYNDIINKHWANDTLYDNTNTAPLLSAASIRNAIRFGWYDTYWNIGNVKGPGVGTIGFEIALEDTTNNRLIDCFRVTDDAAYVCGNTVIHSGNIGSQSVSYATSAGDADTLDGYHASYFAEATHTHSTLQSNFTNTGASNIPFYGSRFEYGILTGDGNPSSDLIALDPYAQVEYLNLPWYTGNYGGQLMFGANSGKIGYRTIHNGTWTSIKEIITRGNLVSETTNWNTITSNPTVFISSEANASNAPITGAYIYGIKMRFHREDNTYQADLVTDLYHDRLFFRRYYDGYIGSWKELAFLDSNVASATYATSAGNADTVDNLHATDFVRNYGTDMPSDSAAMIGYGKTPDGWNTYGPAMTFGISSYFINIQNEYNQDILYYRRYTNGSYGNWKTIAFTDSNVASATQLQTSRKLWGNYFNGTADVTGYMQFSNGDLIHAKDNGGTDRYVLGLTDSVSLGYGTAAGGIATGIYGNSIGLYYGTSHTAGLTLDSTGNVGIGTTQPSEKLHVAGNILANGNIVANGGVAARGMATLQGGAGTGNPVTQINVGSTAYTPSNGVVSLPAYPTWSTLSGKPSNVSAFTNDSGYIDSSALAVTFTTTTLTSSSTSLYLNNTVQRSTLQKVTISSANAYQTFTLNLTGNGSYYGYHRQVLVMNNSGQSINLSLAGANYIYIGTYEILTNGGWQHNDSNPIPMDSNNQMFLLDIIQASSSEYPVVKVTRMNFWAD